MKASSCSPRCSSVQSGLRSRPYQTRASSTRGSSPFLQYSRFFPGEICCAPRSWVERACRDLIYFHEVDKGGHFAEWELPQLFAEEVRAAFRSLL